MEPKTQAECKAAALRHVELSNEAETMDGQRNMLLAAQVYAMLAAIPDVAP